MKKYFGEAPDYTPKIENIKNTPLSNLNLFLKVLKITWTKPPRFWKTFIIFFFLNKVSHIAWYFLSALILHGRNNNLRITNSNFLDIKHKYSCLKRKKSFETTLPPIQ